MDKKELPLWAVNIKKARLNRRETQAEFSKRFGVTQQAVASWENATYEIPARVGAWLLVEFGAISMGKPIDEHDWTK